MKFLLWQEVVQGAEGLICWFAGLTFSRQYKVQAVGIQDSATVQDGKGRVEHITHHLLGKYEEKVRDPLFIRCGNIGEWRCSRSRTGYEARVAFLLLVAALQPYHHRVI